MAVLHLVQVETLPKASPMVTGAPVCAVCFLTLL